MSDSTEPDENDPTRWMTDADKEHLHLVGSVAKVRTVFESYVQAGFSEDQALDLTKHIMAIGMQAATIRELEAHRRQPRSFLDIFGLRSESEADKKLREDVLNQQKLTKEEPTDGDAAA